MKPGRSGYWYTDSSESLASGELVELDAFKKLAEGDAKSAGDLRNGVKPNRLAFLDAIDRPEAAFRGGSKIFYPPVARLALRSDFRAQVHGPKEAA